VLSFPVAETTGKLKATDINQYQGYRTVEQGAIAAVRLATLPDDASSGGFFDENGVVPW
jgi:hypothetical protein